MSTLSPSSEGTIIQGGMGIGVSSWRLARRVAEIGEVGVVSGTAIDAVLVRELQDGDPHGRLEVLETYPDAETVEEIRRRYYVPEGKAPDEPYRPKPIHRFNPKVRSQRLLSAAAYSEVRLATGGHSGTIGINLMAKLKRYTLGVLYGAMLGGVDLILMGAGIPREEAKQVLRLAEGKPASLSLDPAIAEGYDGETSFSYELDPADLVPSPEPIDAPPFYPIVSSDVLARVLDRRLPGEAVDGWVIEMPEAGGHNAPPRGKQYDEQNRPVYDEKDEVDLDRIRGLGKPFYLAGGYGRPDGLRAALAQGAEGIQVGTLFSLAEESGYPEAEKRRLIRAAHRDRLRIRTDGRVSPTGFPFKVIEAEGTLADPERRKERERICDLGYLREPYVDEKGRVLGRCPAEPVADYERKGGAPEETRGRACLCNALMANIGHPQIRPNGPELPLYTGGDQLEDLPLGSADDPSYDAATVITYLRGELKAA